jgi:hypothetical protein
VLLVDRDEAAADAAGIAVVSVDDAVERSG